jgi:hypothetical protein
MYYKQNPTPLLANISNSLLPATYVSDISANESYVYHGPVGKGVGPENRGSEVRFPNWTWVKTLGKPLILFCFNLVLRMGTCYTDSKWEIQLYTVSCANLTRGSKGRQISPLIMFHSNINYINSCSVLYIGPILVQIHCFRIKIIVLHPL